METSQDENVLTCYRNAVRNANTPIVHNIAFLGNMLGIDIDNNEMTLDISLPKVYLTNEQRVLLSNLKKNALTYTTFPKFTFYLLFTCFYLLHIMSYFICVYSSLCRG